jgi:hypothetical protein
MTLSQHKKIYKLQNMQNELWDFYEQFKKVLDIETNGCIKLNYFLLMHEHMLFFDLYIPPDIELSNFMMINPSTDMILSRIQYNLGDLDSYKLISKNL